MKNNSPPTAEILEILEINCMFTQRLYKSLKSKIIQILTDFQDLPRTDKSDRKEKKLIGFMDFADGGIKEKIEN